MENYNSYSYWHDYFMNYKIPFLKSCGTDWVKYFKDDLKKEKDSLKFWDRGHTDYTSKINKVEALESIVRGY